LAHISLFIGHIARYAPFSEQNLSSIILVNLYKLIFLFTKPWRDCSAWGQSSSLDIRMHLAGVIWLRLERESPSNCVWYRWRPCVLRKACQRASGTAGGPVRYEKPFEDWLVPWKPCSVRKATEYGCT